MAEKRTKNGAVQDVRLKQDIAAFKASVVFLLFCAVIFFTVTHLTWERGSLYMTIRYFIEDYPWILSGFFLLFGLCCIWKFVNIRKHKDESYSYFSSGDACGVSLFLLVFALTLTMTYHMSVILTITVGYALCYYVKHFFQKDFFLITLLNLDIALALWLAFGSIGMDGGVANFAKTLFALAAALGFVVICYMVFRLIKKGKKHNSEKLTFVPAVISLVIGAALAALMFFAGATVTILIAEIVLLVQYVGLGVYYTVRLLNQ